MAISASYYKEMSIALPGQVSDTSRYNVDGACVLGGDTKLMAGLAVKVSEAQAVPGHKVVAPLSAAGDKALGVAIRSHFATTDVNGEMVYIPGDGINVLTSGRVWMIAESSFTPSFGQKVKLHTDGKVKSDGTIDTDWCFAGGYTKWQDLFLVEIQLHQI